MIELNDFFENVFAHNTDAQLIDAINKGLSLEFSERGFGDLNLYTAALIAGSPEVVKACLDNGADVDYADTPTLDRPFPEVSTLNIAMEHGRTDILDLLLSEGAGTILLCLKGIAWNMRMNFCPETGEEFSDFKRKLDAGSEILKVFAKHKEDIPGLSSDYSSASFFNLDYNPEILQDRMPLPDREVEAFFELSIDSEYMPCAYPCQGTRPNALWHAATPLTMKELLKTTDPNTVDLAGWTALHHVAMYGGSGYYFSPEATAQVLIDGGADVNASNNLKITPLMFACGHAPSSPRMFEVVKVLMRNGANPRIRDNASCGTCRRWLATSFMNMHKYQCEMMFEVLEEIYSSVKHNRMSALNLDLFVKSLWGGPKEIGEVLAKGANIDVASFSGYTPLMMAAVFNDVEAIKYLLERGADVSLKDAKGETALSYAAKNSDIEKMTALIEGGGDFVALRWIDRNFYTKHTTGTRYNSVDEEALQTLRHYGLNY